MNDHEAGTPDGAATEAQLTAQLEALIHSDALTVLEDLASALFPSGAGTLKQLTWGSVTAEGRVVTDQPPVDEAAKQA